MKTKNHSAILKFISVAVIVSLLLAACAPGNAILPGAAGADATEPPVAEPAATEPPVVEPAATEPPVAATEPPVVEPVATEPPVIPTDTPTNTPESAPVGGGVVEVPTNTPTPTATVTVTSTQAAGAAGVGSNNNSAAATNTPTPTSTPTAQAVAAQQNQQLAAAAAVAIEDPYLGLSVACNRDLSATFTIGNFGGPLSGGSYTITEPGKPPVTASLDLAPNQSISFNTAGNATVAVAYTTSELERVDLSAIGTCLPLPVDTATNTTTATSTPTVTRTPTITKTATPTKTPTSTITPGPSPTASSTNTSTPTKTATPTKTPTSTITPGPSPTATNTKTQTPTRTPTNTKTPTTTVTPGPSPTATNTKTQTPTRTPTITKTVTTTPTITSTPTSTPTREIIDGQLDLQVFCNPDKSATFVIRNISGSVSNGNYVLTDPALSSPINLQPGGTISLKGAGNAVMTVTYRTTFLSSVTLSTVGSCLARPTNTPTNTPTVTPTVTMTSTPTNTPPAPPTLSATGMCTGNNTGSATFVITNNGSDMTTPYTYNITDDKGVIVATDTFQLSAGGSKNITVSGSSSTYTLSSPNDNTLTAQADMSLCVLPPPPPAPALTVTGACTSVIGTATFIVTNKGSVDMPAAYTYNVKDANGIIVDTNTFQLAAGTSSTITVSGSSTSYTFSSPNDAGLTTVADMSLCVLPPPPPPPPPVLAATGVCTSNAGIATFVITNTGAAMTTPYTYNVTDDSGKVVQTSTFQLAAGASVTVTVSGSSKSYTLASPNDPALKAVADMSTCVVPPAPVLSASGVCTSNAGEATFIVTNKGADMSTPYTYEIKDASGVVVKTATFQLIAGQSITIPVTGSSTLYTLSSPNDSALTAKADMSTCVTPPPPPALTATGVCTAEENTASFIITNNGGDMTTAYIYTIKDIYGNIIQTGTPFQLTAGQSLTITVRGVSTGLILSITNAGNLTAEASMANCHEPVPAVAPAQPSICIQCLVFHTFRDENLEVYRLDGIEGQPGFKLYNLSQDEAVDSRPSRAPNDSNVVFQSNRDGNVELYYTDLLGSGEATRLTETESNNTNPMYGPDARTIVYQSDRNGNFDLFTIDQSTGEELQITSDTADDVNPFYSPDLKWLVFQSNRNNNWDIFILNVETGNEYQLTDTPTDETFPSWSPNGRQIAYLVNSAGNTDLYIVDQDGDNLKRITVDGQTNNHVWSHEGNRIAYQSERKGNLDVYSYDLINAKEYRVTTYEGIDSGPTWDCGSSNLAFTSDRDGDPNIFQVYWQGGSAGNMTIDPATDKWSQWRPSNDVSSVGY